MICWVYAFVDRPMGRFVHGSAFWTTVTGTGLSTRRDGNGEFATLLTRLMITTATVPSGGE